MTKKLTSKYVKGGSKKYTAPKFKTAKKLNPFKRALRSYQ